MKRKITQIGRLFAAAALFFGASSWASAQETVTATWALTEGGVQAATFSAENVLEGTMSAVSPFDFVGTENWRDAENAYLDPEVLFTQVSPSEKASAPQAAISFTLTPVEGVTFIPTKLTVNAGRFGSDSGNQLDVYVKTSAGSVKLNDAVIEPLRSQKAMYTEVALDIKDIAVKGEPVIIEFWFKCDATKKVGLNNLVITGTYTQEAPAAAPKVAYLCGATETTEGVYNALVAAGMDVIALNYDDKTLTGELEADGLAGYDLVVLAGKTGSSSALAASFDKIVGKVPVLSTKAFWYAKTSPAGTNGDNPGTAETPSLSIDRVDLYAEHDIFAGIDGNNIGVFNASDAITTGRYMQSNGQFADNTPAQTTIATVGGQDAIAEAWVDGKGFVMIPFDANDATCAADGLTEAGAKLFVNAANYLIAGKQYEVPYVGTCPKPVITTTRIDQTVKYTLSITATAEPAIDGLKIYYTIDGSEPTAETGTLYDAETPVELVNDCTVKAIACADKYRNSEVAEYAFVNEAMTKLATPVIATAQNEKDVTVTITSTNEGVEPTAYAIYYTIDGTEPTANSKVYTEPFTFAGGSATVKAIAIGEGYKNSDVATQQITNTGYVAREKTLYQSDFNMLPTSWGYYDPESCDEQYSGKGIAADPNASWDKNITFIDKGKSGSGKWHDWAFESSKCRVFLPIQQALGGVGSAYGPATEADAGATQGALAYTDESGTSVTFTYTKQLEAPFDIIMYLGTGSTSGTLKCAVQVSDDMTEWETIENISQPVDKMIHKQVLSYDGTGKKYIRLDFAGSSKNSNGMLFDFIVKGIGQDELTLLSMSPTAGTKEEPKEIDKAQTVFTATFNLNAVIGDAVAYFGAPVEGEAYTKNCEIVAEGNKVTITRPEADKELAAGNYVLYLSGVKDEQGAALKTPITAYYYVKAQLPTPTLAEPKQEDTYVSVVVNPLAEEYTDYNFYYTTDGSTPTTSSFLYDGTSIKFYGESATIKVIAAGEKYIASGVAETAVVNENYMAREKVVYTNDFHTPHSEWFYLVDFTYDEADTTKAVNAVVKDGAVWPEGITYSEWSEKDHFRVHIFPKGNEYTGYRQYAGWSFYGESGRRMFLQDNKGLALLGSSGKASVAPDSMFVGPFDIDIQVSGAKSAAKVQIFVGDELEGNSWELIGEATAPAGEKATITGSYNGTDKKYVRVETTTSEIYFDKFIVKAPGYGELKLQSVSPAGGAYDAPAVLEETADTFVLTFNNPLATEQDADLVVFFAAPALPVHNCTYTIEGNTMTVTRPDATTPLAAGTYQFIVKGVKDVAGQVLGSQLNTFYKVEGSSSSVNAPEVEKTVVSTVIYSISGAVQSELAPGLNFVRTTYSDGTVEVEKVIKK